MKEKNEFRCGSCNEMVKRNDGKCYIWDEVYVDTLQEIGMYICPFCRDMIDEANLPDVMTLSFGVFQTPGCNNCTGENHGQD